MWMKVSYVNTNFWMNGLLSQLLNVILSKTSLSMSVGFYNISGWFSFADSH